jgi:hypothetical protein
MYDRLLDEVPSLADYLDFLQQLDSGALTRAELVYELITSAAYMNVQNRVLDFYRRLAIIPARLQFENQIKYVRVPANGNLLPLVDYSPVTGSPFGATDGQAEVAQQIIDSPAFGGVWPNADTIRQMSSTEFIVWFEGRITATMGTPAASGNTFLLRAAMEQYTADARQGFAVAFLTALYSAQLANDPVVNTNQRNYQYQLWATSVQWLLGGAWATPTAPAVTTEEGLLAFIDKLVAVPEVVLTAPASGFIDTPIPLSATATSKSSQGIVGVEFLIDGIVRGTDLTAPYNFEFVPTTAGVYQILARAADGLGNVGLSSTLTLTVIPKPALPPPPEDPAGNPAGDGISNLLKYAFNLDPEVNYSDSDAVLDRSNGNATTGLPVVSLEADGVLQITYIRRRGAENTITYQPQFTSDLQSEWSNGEEVIVQIIDDAWERVTVNDNLPAGSNQRFGRVHVEVHTQ